MGGGIARAWAVEGRMRRDVARARRRSTVWLFYHTSNFGALGGPRRLQRSSHAHRFLAPRRHLEDSLDEARVQGVARSVRGDLADYRPANESQVADEVEDLVAGVLVPEPERAAEQRLLVAGGSG